MNVKVFPGVVAAIGLWVTPDIPGPFAVVGIFIVLGSLALSVRDYIVFNIDVIDPHFGTNFWRLAGADLLFGVISGCIGGVVYALDGTAGFSDSRALWRFQRAVIAAVLISVPLFNLCLIYVSWPSAPEARAHLDGANIFFAFLVFAAFSVALESNIRQNASAIGLDHQGIGTGQCTQQAYEDALRVGKVDQCDLGDISVGFIVLSMGVFLFLTQVYISAVSPRGPWTRINRDWRNYLFRYFLAVLGVAASQILTTGGLFNALRPFVLDASAAGLPPDRMPEVTFMVLLLAAQIIMFVALNSRKALYFVIYRE